MIKYLELPDSCYRKWSDWRNKRMIKYLERIWDVRICSRILSARSKKVLIYTKISLEKSVLLDNQDITCYMYGERLAFSYRL